MNNIARALLAATAIGVVSVSSASAMPLNHLSAALGATDVQNVRVVCNRSGQCFNTVRSGRRAYAPRYQAAPQYYAGPQYGYAGPQYGYYSEPGIGFGIGPFGFHVW